MKFLRAVICVLSLVLSAAHSQNREFPQQQNFPGCIKPNNVTQDQMNTTVANYYNQWKSRYVKRSTGGEIGEGFYVNMTGTGGSGTEVTTSEAHGYGMIIFALMAGYDDSAKIYFDGMVNLFDLHRSTINDNLMSWVIDPENGDSDGATDGDMDIAYALLLAHNQWGSNGSINYLAKADIMIREGIKGDDVRSAGSKRTTLGDWDSSPYNTRASDWMADHMRAYYAYTNDPFWLNAADTVYSLINAISSTHSRSTGLMPDFIVGNPPVPAPAGFLEAETDGDYSWNACRFPWRIAIDYAHYGTPAAKQSLDKILTWLKGATNNKPQDIVAGYKLDGTPIEGVYYSDMAFTAPFIAACVSDATHQDYLNIGWHIIRSPQFDYYGDSIGLLCLLFISGNWWKPDGAALIAAHVNKDVQNLLSHAFISNNILTVSYDLPFTGTVNISIFNSSGKILRQTDVSCGKKSVQFETRDLRLKSGVYMVKIAASGYAEGISFSYLKQN